MKTARDLQQALTQRFGEAFAVDVPGDAADRLASLAEHRVHRDFLARPVPDELLRTICACALSSPSKSDLQQRDLVVVTDAGLRSTIADLMPQYPWLRSAPVLIVVCLDARRLPQIAEWRGKPFPNDHFDLLFNAATDAAIALAWLQAAVDAAGLGGCPLSEIRNHAQAVSDLLGLPDKVAPYAGFCLGWPAREGEVTPRLPLAVTLHENRFDETNLRESIDAYDRRREDMRPTRRQRPHGCFRNRVDLRLVGGQGAAIFRAVACAIRRVPARPPLRHVVKPLKREPTESRALLLFALCLCGLAASVSARSMDPLVSVIAADFSIGVASAALIVSAYTLPFALGQPVLGPLGDVYGRPRLLKICLWLLAGFLVAASLAPSLDFLFVARFCAGLVAGGIVPACMATIGDTYAPDKRQMAISKFVTVGLLAQIFSASASGALAHSLGWRSVLVAMACLAVVAAVMASFVLRGAPERPQPFSIGLAAANYRRVFSNPKALLCYSTVFMEGLAVYGMLPYVGEVLRLSQRGGPREAGLVIGSIGIGGLVYTAILPLLLRRFSRYHFMAAGGALIMTGPLGLASGLMWQAVAACFFVTGFGFMLLHNSIQTEVVDLAPGARQSAYSLHAFSFFTGQAIGPALYGLLLATLGPAASIVCGGVAMLATGVSASFLFRRLARKSGAT